MKKITFSLKIGLVGAENSQKEIILEFLNQSNLKSKIDSQTSNYQEFFLLSNNIPFKLKVFSSLNLVELGKRAFEIDKLDVLLLVVNATEIINKNNINKDLIDEFKQIYYFDGISALIGILLENKYEIMNNIILQEIQANLIRNAKELDFLYCYLIKNFNNEISQVFKTITSDFTLKFKFSNPELYEYAKAYGREVLKRNSLTME